jgi:hypothetical protein
MIWFLKIVIFATLTVVPLNIALARQQQVPTAVVQSATPTIDASVTAVALADVMRTERGGDWWPVTRRGEWGPADRYGEWAGHFVTQGLKWGVSPVIVACVAYAESRYHATPPTLWKHVCTNVYVDPRCSAPGPCNPEQVRKCRPVRANVAESGMMQVLWNDASTRIGYHACTGKQLSRNKTEAQAILGNPEVGICVGAYELSKWQRWGTVGGFGLIKCRLPGQRGVGCPNRMTPRDAISVDFFKFHPELLRFHWVAFYNWGSNRWRGNGYPRHVLWCYKRYKRALAKRALQPSPR